MSELFAKGVLHGLIGPGAVILNDYVLTVSDIDGGHRLTIARGNDVQTLDVLDGRGAVESVNGRTGKVQLTAADVGAATMDEVLDLLVQMEIAPVLLDDDGSVLADGDGAILTNM